MYHEKNPASSTICTKMQVDIIKITPTGSCQKRSIKKTPCILFIIRFFIKWRCNIITAKMHDENNYITHKLHVHYSSNSSVSLDFLTQKSENSKYTYSLYILLHICFQLLHLIAQAGLSTWKSNLRVDPLPTEVSEKPVKSSRSFWR